MAANDKKLNVQITGDQAVIVGKTYPIRDDLKAIGATFNEGGKLWTVSADAFMKIRAALQEKGYAIEVAGVGQPETFAAKSPEPTTTPEKKSGNGSAASSSGATVQPTNTQTGDGQPQTSAGELYNPNEHLGDERPQTIRWRMENDVYRLFDDTQASGEMIKKIGGRQADGAFSYWLPLDRFEKLVGMCSLVDVELVEIVPPPPPKANQPQAEISEPSLFSSTKVNTDENMFVVLIVAPKMKLAEMFTKLDTLMDAEIDAHFRNKT